MTMRDEIRKLIVEALTSIDNNDGFGKIILLLSTAIVKMASIYALTDQ